MSGWRLRAATQLPAPSWAGNRTERSFEPMMARSPGRETRNAAQSASGRGIMLVTMKSVIPGSIPAWERSAVTWPR